MPLVPNSGAILSVTKLSMPDQCWEITNMLVQWSLSYCDERVPTFYVCNVSFAGHYFAISYEKESICSELRKQALTGKNDHKVQRFSQQISQTYRQRYFVCIETPQFGMLLCGFIVLH